MIKLRQQVAVRINNGEPLRGSFRLARAVDTVMSEQPEPDPRWEMVDSNGHYHAYSAERPEYPTLDLRSEHVECDGSCGGVCEGEGYSISRYFCRICEEEIKPGSIPGPHRIDIPGLWEWSVSVEGYLPGEGFILPAGDTVSVCVDLGDEQRWGIAMLVDMSTSNYECRAELVGVGPLGTRMIKRNRVGNV